MIPVELYLSEARRSHGRCGASKNEALSFCGISLILVDANLLLYAYNENYSENAATKTWLDDVLSNPRVPQQCPETNRYFFSG